MALTIESGITIGTDISMGDMPMPVQPVISAQVLQNYNADRSTYGL